MALADEHKLQYAKDRERECLEVKIYCKLDFEVEAVNVGKRMEAKVTAMRSKFHLTSDIFGKIYFIKSFQWCYITMYYEEISPKAK